MYDITLDTNKGGFQAVLEGFKVGDTNTRRVAIRLMSGLKPYSLPLKEDGSADYTATLYIKGATATHYSECDEYPDRIEHTFLTSEVGAGVSECEIRVTGSDGSVLTSAKFKIIAEAVLQSDGAIEASDSYSALTEALTRVMGAESGLALKMDKATGATEGNAAVFGSDGGVVDGGVTIAKTYTVEYKDEYSDDEKDAALAVFSEIAADTGTFSVMMKNGSQIMPATYNKSGRAAYIRAVWRSAVTNRISKIYEVNVVNGNTLSSRYGDLYCKDMTDGNADITIPPTAEAVCDFVNGVMDANAVTDDHINELIDTKLGVIENGTY